MGLAGSTRRVAGTIGFLAFAMGASVCRADCDHAVYAYDERVVVFACGKGGPELRVIVLDDASSLKIAGRVAVPSSREFDTADHYKNFLMLVRWDKFEVYDLADPIHPTLAAKFDLSKHENLSGYERIEQTAANKFLVITSMGVVEVTTDGEPRKWSLKEFTASAEIKKRMSSQPPSWRFVDQNAAAVPVWKTEKFRYELSWEDKSKPGAISHRQYLRKVDLATQKATSLLLLGERLETID